MFFKWPDPSLFPRCGREEGYTAGETRARLEESRRSRARGAGGRERGGGRAGAEEGE